jgi:hypothetical protein
MYSAPLAGNRSRCTLCFLHHSQSQTIMHHHRLGTLDSYTKTLCSCSLLLLTHKIKAFHSLFLYCLHGTSELRIQPNSTPCRRVHGLSKACSWAITCPINTEWKFQVALNYQFNPTHSLSTAHLILFVFPGQFKVIPVRPTYIYP